MIAKNAFSILAMLVTVLALVPVGAWRGRSRQLLTTGKKDKVQQLVAEAGLAADHKIVQRL